MSFFSIRVAIVIRENELDVGGVLIGDVPSFRVDNMPYGGVKDSGIGREGIRFAIDDMSEIRSLTMLDRIQLVEQIWDNIV